MSRLILVLWQVYIFVVLGFALVAVANAVFPPWKSFKEEVKALTRRIGLAIIWPLALFSQKGIYQIYKQYGAS